MRGAMWICVLLICVSEAWSRDPGPSPRLSKANERTLANLTTVFARRNATFALGSQVNLTCSNNTGERTVYVIWSLKLKSRECMISIDEFQMIVDTCKDGKRLQNSSGSQTHLHIPRLSAEDVGMYKCEFVYAGGKEDHIINLSIIVPPQTRAWFEPKNNKMEAVCKAERGNPAANISWSHTGNAPSYQTLPQSDGSVTVESRLQLPEDADPADVRCVVTHPFWDEAQTVVPQAKNANFPWLFITIIVVVAVVLIGSVSFALRKLITWRRNPQPHISSSKIPPTEYVEEVEPYASYVQRVNSIYNSSADLFA
ncbi:unnamed protein product [Ophioblennius macclurei]